MPAAQILSDSKALVRREDHPVVMDGGEEAETPAAVVEISKSLGADAPRLNFFRGTYTRRLTDAPYSALPSAGHATPPLPSQTEDAEPVTASSHHLRHIDLSV